MQQPNSENILCQCILPYLFDIKPWHVMLFFRIVSKYTVYITDKLLGRYGCISIDIKTFGSIIIDDASIPMLSRFKLYKYMFQELGRSRDNDFTYVFMNYLVYGEYDAVEIIPIVSDLMVGFIDKLRNKESKYPLEQFAKLVEETGTYNRILNIIIGNGLVKKSECVKSYLAQVAFTVNPDKTTEFVCIDHDTFLESISRCKDSRVTRLVCDARRSSS